MIPILVLKTENKVIYNKSNLNCKTFFEEFIYKAYLYGTVEEYEMFTLIHFNRVNIQLHYITFKRF